MRNLIMCPFSSIYATIAFDSSDWGTDKNKAWIYGIVIGWDSESMTELEARHGWRTSEVERLRFLHNKFKKTLEKGE